MQIVDANTVSLIASFDEPAVSTGAPLAYYYIGYTANGGALVAGPHIPAAPAGGQTETGLTLMVPAPAGMKTDFVFDAFAVDVNGVTSAPSNLVNLSVNRIAPPAPVNFTIG